MLYFDYAAATPMSDKVLSAMKPFWQEKFYNPSALYLSAQDVHGAVGSARAEVAKILGARTSEVIFTAGGTESDNLAVRGVMERFAGKNCIVSAIEHDAVLEPAKNYGHKIVPVDQNGFVDLNKLAEVIDDDTVLISIMYANNEIGTIQPLAEISKILNIVRSERRAKGNGLPLYLHTDACQAANYLPLLVNTLGVDLMTLNGGKIYGPKQSGILYVKSGVTLAAQVLGGGQERGLRSGTENVSSIVGFAAALTDAADMREAETKRVIELRNELIENLINIRGDIVVNGASEPRLANNVHITVPGIDNERLLMELDEKGIMVATGSACSASSDDPSHVLSAIGLSDEQARSSLRITLGRSTTAADIKKLTDTLSELVAS